MLIVNIIFYLWDNSVRDSLYYFTILKVIMIDHLIQFSENFLLDATEFESFQYGSNILQYNGNQIDLTNIDIAILGWNNKHYHQIRKSLYQLTDNFKGLKVIDLGEVTSNLVPLIELVDILLKHQVFPIVIAPDETAILGQLRAYEQRDELLNLALVCPTIPYSTSGKNYIINQLLSYHPHLLFHLQCIGYQNYLADPKAIDYLEDKYFELERLGKLQANMEEFEPMVRDLDLAAFDVKAIRCADAPATSFKNPNGLQAVDACKVMRYLTMSDRLSSLCICGFDLSIDDNNQTANMIAQMIWFAIEGFSIRIKEYPVDIKELQTYVIDNKTFGMPISFHKSTRSERWWFEIPQALHSKHQLVPCSYQDYKIACEGDLPDRLLNAINRLS